MPEPHTPARKRRVMRRFVINEISMVDRPAQEGARMVLMKRADEQENDNMNFHKIIERPRSFDDFESAMTYLCDAHGLSKLDAMRKVAHTRPDLVRKYNAEGEAIAKAAAERDAAKYRKSDAEDDFMMLVDGIAARDGASRHVAMERARKEHPGAFRAFQAA